MKKHDFGTFSTPGGMTFRMCASCGHTDFLERVDIKDAKGEIVGDGFDWVPVYERNTDGKATVTPRECAGDYQPVSNSAPGGDDRLQRKLEEARNKQASANAGNNSRRV